MAEVLRPEQIREIVGKVDNVIRGVANNIGTIAQSMVGDPKPKGWRRLFHRGPPAQELLEKSHKMLRLSEDTLSLTRFRTGLMVALGEEKPRIIGKTQTYQFELDPQPILESDRPADPAEEGEK